MQHPAYSLTLRTLFGLSITLAIGSAHAEVIDFNDLSLAGGTQSFSLDNPPVPTGFYVNGPMPNAVADVDLVSGDNVLRGSFASGAPAAGVFSNSYDTQFGTASGFSYSNVNDTQDNDFTNQFAAITGVGAGPGVNGAPDQYAIVFGHLDQKANSFQTFAFDPTSTTQLAALPNIQIPTGYQFQSVEVTNTTYAALTMLNGDPFGFTQPFASGIGFLELTAYGTDALGQVLAAHPSFLLADYRGDENTIVTDWQLFDLSALSGATTIYFNLSSSDVGQFGMNTPAYFALDNVRITQVPEPTSLALLMIAGLGLAFTVRYRSRSR